MKHAFEPLSEQLNLFDGETFEADRDEERLAAQLKRVFELMSDGRPRTLNEIAAVTSDPPASISARLRDLRKERFGSHDIQRRYIQRGLFEYRLVVPK